MPGDGLLAFSAAMFYLVLLISGAAAIVLLVTAVIEVKQHRWNPDTLTAEQYIAALFGCAFLMAVSALGSAVATRLRLYRPSTVPRTSATAPPPSLGESGT